MIISNLKNMVRGWFVGMFEPTLYKTSDVEVAVKRYKAGDSEPWHFHKIATEFTVVISGVISLNGQKFFEDDIITVTPHEGVLFVAETDAVTVCVKLPGASNDKFTKPKELKMNIPFDRLLKLHSEYEKAWNSLSRWIAFHPEENFLDVEVLGKSLGVPAPELNECFGILIEECGFKQFYRARPNFGNSAFLPGQWERLDQVPMIMLDENLAEHPRPQRVPVLVPYFF